VRVRWALVFAVFVALIAVSYPSDFVWNWIVRQTWPQLGTALGIVLLVAIVGGVVWVVTALISDKIWNGIAWFLSRLGIRRRRP
jgi:hypothetical protein